MDDKFHDLLKQNGKVSSTQSLVRDQQRHNMYIHVQYVIKSYVQCFTVL